MNGKELERFLKEISAPIRISGCSDSYVYRTFNNKEDALIWIVCNCEIYNGEIFYMGNAVEFV